MLTDGRTTDGRRIPLYTISSPMSLRLRCAKNTIKFYKKWPMVLLRTVIKSKFENYTDNQMCVTKMQVEQVNSEDYNTDDDPLSIQMMQKKRTLWTVVDC